ncbi:MAG: hypothetical protein FJZ47_06255 [Candidatus Tectomicrobia bacterium]|uniref:Uncharacterized protein n=1 Tax=Tectimicrobiota bacterium TaxID=2528274 RepID=A0A937VYF8_UNCTE|nr:hypothetical protein [Candidatus Tectomicrobia bacterium]
MLVGAYALAAHGLPRATGAMDLSMRCSDDKAQRVWRALQRFGAPLTDVTLDDFNTPHTVLQIGVAPQCVNRTLAGVPEDEKKLLLYGNAMRIYKL